jgi:hypothetical protein
MKFVFVELEVNPTAKMLVVVTAFDAYKFPVIARFAVVPPPTIK